MGIFNKLEKLKQIKGETKSALINPKEISNIEGVEDAELIVDEILGEQL